MPKKEICVNTGIEISIEKVFNFASPEQVYEKLVKLSEESVKPFKNKFGEPSRLLFKTKKYTNNVSVQVHFMRMETDEEFEERMKERKRRKKMEVDGVPIDKKRLRKPFRKR